MALCVCFSRLTNLFFSQLPDNYEVAFWEEIWGCVNYIKIPYDTVMKMPVQNRKILIQRHNYEGEKRSMEAEEKNRGTVAGEALNAYAAQEQQKIASGIPT